MKKAGKIILAAAGVALAAGMIGGLEINEYDVYSPKLPEEFDGYTIAHISDYHSVCMPELIKKIKALNPNIIVSTGDMVNRGGEADRAIEFAKRLMEIAPLYLVRGNHDVVNNDHKKLEKICNKEDSGFLYNESCEVEYKGKKIMISGIDDPVSGAESVIKKRIDDALAKINSYDGFHMLLFHRANLAEMFKDSGFDLILAGHMHGGQVRIPKLGGVIAPKQNFYSERILFPQYTGGRYDINGTELIVSRGIGNHIPVPRVYNNPEIVVIKLRTGVKDEI